MNMKNLFAIVLFLTVNSMSFAVTNFVDEFSQKAGEPLSSEWELSPTWDESPYSINYNGNGQLEMSLTGEKQIWSSYSIRKKIGPGDFEAIATVSDMSFYEGEGEQFFLFEVWDLKGEAWGDPHWGFTVKFGNEKGRYYILLKYRNGDFEESIREINYFILKYPLKIRIDWDEINQTFAAYYSFGGGYPDILIAITEDYSIRAKTDRFVTIAVQQSLNQTSTTKAYIDKFELKDIDKNIVAEKKPEVSTTHPGGRGGVGSDISGQWDFDKFDGAPTIGKDIRFFGNTTQSNTYFGTTKELGVSNINGEVASIMGFPAYSKSEGLAIYPSIPPNGEGENANQYSIVMDVLFNNSETNKWAILQTNSENEEGDEAELYFSKSSGKENGIGISDSYSNSTPPLETGKWYRIAVTVDLTKKIMYEYVNGKYIGKIENFSNIDGRLSLTSTKKGLPFLMFTENKGDKPANTGSGCLNSLQIRPYVMSAEEISNLGGPSAAGISVAGKVEDNIDKGISDTPKPESTTKPIAKPKEEEKVVKPVVVTPPPVIIPQEPAKFYNYTEGMDKITSQEKRGILLFTHPSVEISKKTKTILTDAALSSILSQYILIEINTKEEKERLQQYNIFKVPTIVIVDNQGNIIKNWALSDDDITINSIKNGIDAVK